MSPNESDPLTILRCTMCRATVAAVPGTVAAAGGTGRLYVLEAHEDCPRMSLERGSRWNQWVETDDNEEWQPSEVGIEFARIGPDVETDAIRYMTAAIGEAMQRAKDRDLDQVVARMFSAPAERIRLNRRQRLRHWLREHRPHVHFGECTVEDEYD